MKFRSAEHGYSRLDYRTGMQRRALSLRNRLQRSRSDTRQWELLIVDDGSTDNTLALAQQFGSRDARIRCLHQDNAGVSAARNMAITAACPQTKYVAFLDADDLWDFDALELMVGMLETDPEAVGTHGLAREIDSAGNPIEGSQREAWGRNRRYIEGRKLLKKELNEPTTFSSVVYDPCFLPSASMVRHSILKAVGSFDTSLHYAEDQDMWLRITRLGHLIFINRAICSYRRHDASAMSKGNKQDIARRTYVRERMFSSAAVSRSASLRRRFLVSISCPAKVSVDDGFIA